MESSLNTESTQSQLNWLVGLIYMASALFLSQLCLALWNSYYFLFNQRKYSTQPLLVFYVLTVLLTGLHLQYMLWFFGEIINQWVFALILMPVVKINMGLDQCWILYELSLRIQQSIRITRQRQESEDQLDVSYDASVTSSKDKATERRIKNGRRLLTIIIAINLTAITIYLIWFEASKTEPKERADLALSWY